ncbi:MAG: T9SS type A sorting domain-containing protein, partial [Fibrobacteres bacterium]|nr:T9SS type A sorting domain-containing protein [Fibrobacterota bacterium]
PGFPIGPLDGNQMGLNLIAYDEANDIILYVYDGVNGTQSLSSNSQTWIFKCDSLVWHQMIPVASPPDRGHLAYNKNLNLFMMLGGTNPSGIISRGGDTKTAWVYRYKKSPRLKDILAAPPVAKIVNSSSSAEISWQTVSGASGYNVYRAACQYGFPQKFAKLNSSSISGNSYTDNSGTAGTMYSYRVAAIKNGTEGLLSRHCYTKPGIITDVAASVEDTHVVKVSWVSRAETDIAGYNVYRAKGSGMFSGALQGYYTKLNSTPVTGSEYTDTYTDAVNNLKDGVCRGYVVTVVNNAGQESGPSPVATTFPNSPEWAYTVPTSGTFRLGWQPPRRTKILGVNLYRKGETLINTSGIITDTVKFSLQWPPNTGTEPYQLADQTYVVRAVNMLGQQGYGTDQISPSVSTYGFGMVTPTSNRFNYTVFTSGTAVEENIAANEKELSSVLTVSPNPFNPMVKVSMQNVSGENIVFSVFDAAGRLVIQRKQAGVRGLNSVVFDLSGRSTGMYLIRASLNGKMIEKKAMLIR